MADCLPKNISLKNILLFLVVAAFLSLLPHSPASAGTLDWLSSGATAELIQDPLINTPRMVDHTHQCRMQKILVGNAQTPLDSCIYQAKSFRFGWVERYIRGVNRSALAISIGNDSRFYAINNLTSHWGDDRWQASPDGNIIVFSNGNVVRVFKNVITSLIQDFTLDGMEYKTSQPLGDYSFGNQGRSVEVAMSSNGEWLGGRMNEYGLFRMRLSDGSVKLFSGVSASQGVFKFSVSNDGRFVVAGNGMSYDENDSNHDARIYRIDFDCGKQAMVFWSRPSEATADGDIIDCPSVSLNNTLEAAGLSDYDRGRFVVGIEYPKFNETGEELNVLEFRASLPGRWVKLYASGYNQPTTLDYLAIGDSYSSGEGDTGKKPDGSSYYLTSTSKDQGCHISVRSYPFLLGSYYDISNAKMASVACSGAKVVSDYLLQNGYLGQHKELQNQSDEQRQATKNAAMSNFTPGILSQIEFIGRYKPKIITLTGGGNDVGFADMLKYCAYGSGNTNGWGILTEGLYGLSTCSYAVPNSTTQKIALKQISDQYNYTKLLLGAIKEASPLSKIYLIGYPSFISNDPLAKCHLRSLELNPSERIVIDYFLRDLNLQLSNAAHDVGGVAYIDIYDSLDGGKMCQSDSPYVTGALDGISNMGGWFHPNALGHQKMADEIYRQMQNPSISNINSEKPSSIGNMFDGVVSSVEMVVGGVVNSGQWVLIDVPPNTFLPNSSIVGMLHSDPISLDGIQADEHGAISKMVYLPDNIDTGFHLLTLEGKTYSGEPLVIYQNIVANPPIDDSIDNKVTNSSGVTFQLNKNSAVNGYGEKSQEYLSQYSANKTKNTNVSERKKTNKNNHDITDNLASVNRTKFGYREILLFFAIGFTLLLIAIIFRKGRK